MVNHPPKGSVQYHSNREYLRQSSRLKVKQFIVLLRLGIFYLYLPYKINIPLSSQTVVRDKLIVVTLNNYNLHSLKNLTFTFIWNL